MTMKHCSRAWFGISPTGPQPPAGGLRIPALMDINASVIGML